MSDLVWWVLIAIGSAHSIANLWYAHDLVDMDEGETSFPLFLLYLTFGWMVYAAIIIFRLDEHSDEY